MKHCIKEALDLAVSKLQSSDQARLEVEVLLAYVLDKQRSYLHAWPEAELSEEQTLRFGELVEQRAEGLPVAYLTGRREFWSLDFEVTADTLIPRPETELLVEQALALLPQTKSCRLPTWVPAAALLPSRWRRKGNHGLSTQSTAPSPVPISHNATPIALGYAMYRSSMPAGAMRSPTLL